MLDAICTAKTRLAPDPVINGIAQNSFTRCALLYGLERALASRSRVLSTERCWASANLLQSCSEPNSRRLLMRTLRFYRGVSDEHDEVETLTEGDVGSKTVARRSLACR